MLGHGDALREDVVGEGEEVGAGVDVVVSGHGVGSYKAGGR